MDTIIIIIIILVLMMMMIIIIIIIIIITTIVTTTTPLNSVNKTGCQGKNNNYYRDAKRTEKETRECYQSNPLGPVRKMWVRGK